MPALFDAEVDAADVVATAPPDRLPAAPVRWMASATARSVSDVHRELRGVLADWERMGEMQRRAAVSAAASAAATSGAAAQRLAVAAGQRPAHDDLVDVALAAADAADLVASEGHAAALHCEVDDLETHGDFQATVDAFAAAARYLAARSDATVVFSGGGSDADVTVAVSGGAVQDRPLAASERAGLLLLRTVGQTQGKVQMAADDAGSPVAFRFEFADRLPSGFRPPTARR